MDTFDFFEFLDVSEQTFTLYFQSSSESSLVCHETVF